MKRVYAQSSPPLDRSGQECDRADFLPTQATSDTMSIRLVVLDPADVEPDGRVVWLARRGATQVREDGARQRAFRSVEQRFIAHWAAPFAGSPSSPTVRTRPPECAWATVDACALSPPSQY